LGLFLWAATFRGDGVADGIAGVLEERLKNTHLHHLPTQDLGWVLTGLCFVKRAELARRFAEEVRSRLGQQGLFRSSSSRSRLAPFNVQAYGLLSLAEYARLSGDREMEKLVLTIGRKLIAPQGPQGEWWWVYNVNRGVVTDRYPVYSVHQDGLGPMALRACNEVCGLEVDAVIKMSLDWIFAKNELHQSLVDESRGLIWRSIRRKWKPGRKWFPRFAFRGMGCINNLVPGKEINRESRAYEYGWILYAFS